MKPANNAPFFACLYAGLCDIARQHGYALAVHGTMARDFDLVAIPWTDAAVSDKELVAALQQHVLAMDYRGLLQRQCGWATPEQIDQMVSRATDPDCRVKPHGRKAWVLYMEHGCQIDLSVMPRVVSQN